MILLVRKLKVDQQSGRLSIQHTEQCWDTLPGEFEQPGILSKLAGSVLTE
jgi:hypothetical protein